MCDGERRDEGWFQSVRNLSTLLYMLSVPLLRSSIPLLLLMAPLFVAAQSLTISLPAGVDTTGMDAQQLLTLERTVTLTGMGFGSAPSSDTLVVELGSTEGQYDMFVRRFPLGETGTFADGCSLSGSGGGLTVGLGSFTGLSTFHLRAYLASVGTAGAVLIND